MKFKLSYILSILTLSIYGQDIQTCNKRLKERFDKIEFYSNQKDTNEYAYDSIDKYNESFEKLLLKYTNSIPETLNFEFKNLTINGLEISTSENNFFRIYSWDTETGGTMRGFRNVFQFKSNNKIFSQKLLSDIDEYGESSFSYEIIDQINSKKKPITL